MVFEALGSLFMYYTTLYSALIASLGNTAYLGGLKHFSIQFEFLDNVKDDIEILIK